MIIFYQELLASFEKDLFKNIEEIKNSIGNPFTQTPHTLMMFGIVKNEIEQFRSKKFKNHRKLNHVKNDIIIGFAM